MIKDKTLWVLTFGELIGFVICIIGLISLDIYQLCFGGFLWVAFSIEVFYWEFIKYKKIGGKYED